MKKRGYLSSILKNLIIIILLIPIVLYCSKTFATTNMTVSANFSESTILANSETTINIAIDKLEDIGEGVNAYIITFEFNTDEFEFVKAEGQNNWNSPTYNETNIKSGKGKMTATRASFTKETGSIAKITLKAKDNFNVNKMPTVKISDISFAAKIENKIQKIELKDINIALNNNLINSENNNSKIVEENRQITKNNKNQSYAENSNLSVTNNGNQATVMLPKAGMKSKILILSFAVLIINVIIACYKYRKINKYI